MRNLLVTGLVALLAGAVVGGLLGHRLGWGSAESERADALQIAAESARLALEATHRLAADEQRRAVAAAEARGRRAAAAQELIHEAAADPDRNCEWSDAHRLRIERIYRAYGYQPAGAAGMYSTLPGPGADDFAPAGLGSGDGLARPGVPSAAR